MSTMERLNVGIIVERSKIDNPWQEFRRKPVDLLLGIAAELSAEWKL